MSGAPRQCAGCGVLLLDPGGRSPYCPRCWKEHQRARNRAKSERFRRHAKARALEEAEAEGRPITGTDLVWLDQLNLGLAEPFRQAIALLGSGRESADPEVRQLLLGVLERYDTLRVEFDQQAALRADPEGEAEIWRATLESIREGYK